MAASSSSSPKTKASLRIATAKDCDTILHLISELAVYEKLSHQVTATPEQLRKTLFGPRAYAECVLAEMDGKAVGFVLFFHNYSTFLGKPALYLEDLYVDSAYRGFGIGKALLIHLAKLALERDCGRFEWSVLDWNKPSIDFYKAMGAQLMDEWTTCRVTGEALHRLAAQNS